MFGSMRKWPEVKEEKERKKKKKKFIYSPSQNLIKTLKEEVSEWVYVVGGKGRLKDGKRKVVEMEFHSFFII